MDALDPDRNLTERLGAAADGIEATPDLAGVIAGADRRRRRSRSIGLGGAAAVVALGVGGVVMVSNRDTNQFPAAQPDPVIVPLTTLPPGADTGDTVPESDDVGVPTSDGGTADEVPASTVLFDASNGYDPNGPDPADQFLDQTEQIYRREMPSGYDLQIRQSNVSYGELFGIEWDLPTGSQSECLGNPAVFIGDPTGPKQWLSAWTAQQWWPIGEANDFRVTEQYFDETSNVIIRTDLDGVSAGILQGDELADTTEFVDGVAVIEMLGFGNGPFNEETEPTLSIAVRSADGAINVQTMALYSEQYGNPGIPDACAGPAFPGSELPEPGAEQPADPAAAEVVVRDRHAILVDRSDAAKPDDILTDDTGVAEARAEMEAGQYGDSAAAAEYTIDEVVFTDAETAWFEYTIVAPTGTFGPRFGQAIFNGEVWQITRQTICQDLSLAGGQCDETAGTVNLQPPLADGVDIDEAQRVWQQLWEAYSMKMNCHPLSPCGEFDLSSQLPDPGEQPVDVAAARVEVVGLMESLYGQGRLLAQLDRIDDPTGIAEAVEGLGDGGYSDEADSASVTVDELVFTAPTVAVFRYTLTTDGYTLTDRIGTADEIDGVWKISSGTVCNDLALAGSPCQR